MYIFHESLVLLLPCYQLPLYDHWGNTIHGGIYLFLPKGHMIDWIDGNECFSHSMESFTWAVNHPVNPLVIGVEACVRNGPEEWLHVRCGMFLKTRKAGSASCSPHAEAAARLTAQQDMRSESWTKNRSRRLTGQNYCWLVVWNINVIFPLILGF